jgi:predicted DsbA family dithiol-disulfide isomerase
VLEEAVRRFGAQVRWHAYELRPEPVPLPDPDSGYIREHWEHRVRPMARQRGLVMTVPRTPCRSRWALETALFARDHGRFHAVDRGIYRARFEHDRDISNLDVLSDIVSDAGLDGAELMHAIETENYSQAVDADIHLAERLAVRGVPAMFVTRGEDPPGMGVPVGGAVPIEYLQTAIARVLSRPQ